VQQIKFHQENDMSLTHDEILDLALRYVSKEEITDFPSENDLFYFMVRTLPKNKVLKDDEGWNFSGYAVCKGYDYDHETKPKGKWLWFYFISLNTFPPTKQQLRLQPPHIARGIFQNPERTNEIKISRIPPYSMGVLDVEQSALPPAPEIPSDLKGKIVPFPRRIDSTEKDSA